MKELDLATPWGAKMKAIRRKTLVVCGDCYERIHRETLKTDMSRIYGEPDTSRGVSPVPEGVYANLSS
jgi:hypothetical protein